MNINVSSVLTFAELMSNNWYELKITVSNKTKIARLVTFTMDSTIWTLPKEGLQST